MHGHHIRFHIEDKRLNCNENTGENAKRCQREEMPKEIEANTSPEELSFRKSFKKRHVVF